jgi:arylformamidase
MRSPYIIIFGVIVAGLTVMLPAFNRSVAPVERNFAHVRHIIDDGMTAYRGIPAPGEVSSSRFVNGVQSWITRVDMVSATGFRPEAPCHRCEEGEDIGVISLEEIARLDAVIVDVYDIPSRSIDETYFNGIDLRSKAVLIRTGWDRNCRTDSCLENHPYLTEGAARYLADTGVTLVGIDTYSIDDIYGKTRPVHSILLKAGIPIVEHLCDLDKVPLNQKIVFNAVPVKIKNTSTFPVSAFVTW